MEFKKIIIENFGGISSIETNPKMVNVLIGPNGAGKSTFLKAVKFGLVGNSTRSQLIKDGETKATVSIDIDTYNIKKTISEKGTSVYLNDRRTTQKSVVEMLQDEYGATKDSMKFLTSSEVFEKATGSEFTEFLLDSGIIPLKIDVNKFLSVCREEEIISAELENEIRVLFPAAPEQFDLNLIGQKNDEIGIIIKSEKKEMARLESIASQVAAVPSTSVRSLEEIKKDYEEVIAKEAKARSFAEIARKIEVTQKQINELQAMYDADKSVRPNPADKETAVKLLNSSKDNITKTAGLIASFKGNNSILSNQLLKLDSNKCPLSDKIICGQDKTEVKEEIKKIIENNENQITVLEIDKEEYESSFKMAENAINDYSFAERAYQNKINILNRLKALKDTIPELPEKAELSADIADKKRELNEEMQFVSRYESALKVKAELDKKTERLSILEELLRLTSKKGNVKAKILKMLLGTLVASMNDMTSKLCPSLKLDLAINESGNVLIQCTTPSGTQDYGDLSTGEKLMVQFLVMAQINLLSGFKILILDNLDKLDTDNFKNLLEFLQQPSIRDYFDHVFVATVDHEDFKKVLSSPTMKDINVVNV